MGNPNDGYIHLRYLYPLIGGVYSSRIETSQEEQCRIRIHFGSVLIHSFPMPLGTEIGHLDRTVTTDVTFFSFAINFVIAFESTCTYFASEFPDERHHTRITCGLTIIHSLSVLLGCEIDYHNRIVTTNVTLSGQLPRILFLLLMAVARI